MLITGSCHVFFKEKYILSFISASPPSPTEFLVLSACPCLARLINDLICLIYLSVSISFSLTLYDFSYGLSLVLPQSDGVEQTNYLAQRYCQEAIRQISRLQASPERDALIRLTELVLTRDK